MLTISALRLFTFKTFTKQKGIPQKSRKLEEMHIVSSSIKIYYLHQLINVYFVNGKWLIDTIKWNWPKFTEFTKVEEKPF